MADDHTDEPHNPQVEVLPERSDDDNEGGAPPAAARYGILGPNVAIRDRDERLTQTNQELREEVLRLKRRLEDRDEIIDKRLRPDRSRYDTLPDKVPEFSGKPSDYQSWKTSIDATVLSRGYSPELKFEAIKRATAKIKNLTHLQHWMGTAEDVDAAMESIKRRYGRQDEAIQQLYKELLDIRPCREDDYTGFENLVDKFKALYDTVKRVGNLESMKQQIKDETVNRLPMTMKREVWRMGVEGCELSRLDQLLEAQIDANVLESCSYRRSSLAQEREPPSSRRVSYSKVAATTQFGCPFDGEAHPLRLCKTSLEERWSKVREDKLCHQCLQSGHQAKDCRTYRPCSTCKARHHGFLCPKYKPSPIPAVTASADKPEETTHAKSAKADGVRYKTTITSLNGTTWRLLVDEAAGENFITTELVSRLCLPIIDGPRMHIYGFGTTRSVTGSEYTIISGLKGIEKPTPFVVLPCLGRSDYQTPPTHVLDQLPEHIKKGYCDSDKMAVEMMLGVTCVQGNLDKPILFYRGSDYDYSYQQSSMGNFVYGGTSGILKTICKSTTVRPDLWEEEQDAEVREEDDYVQRFLKTRVRVADGRIEVRLPVINTMKIESNEGKCKVRLTRNVHRWERQGTLDIVKRILKEWEDLGIIERVEHRTGKEHYLSYHIVTKLSSTSTKYRLVFDGSLTDRYGIAINDLIFKGQTSWNLIKSLLRFRQRQYPLLGDLTKAFLMVSLHQDDRDWFRFFYPDLESFPMFRFARVPFGTSSSPFLLYIALRRIADEATKRYPELQNFVEWFYVDDVVMSFSTHQERETARTICEQMMTLYGFQVNWNDQAVTSVLGLPWNVELDRLNVPIPKLSVPTTLRQLASLIPSIFDPFGWAEPVISDLRRTFSELWRQLKMWDQTLTAEQQLPLARTLRWLETNSCLELPRYVGECDQRVIYHVFCDANDKCIAAVIYVQHESSPTLNLIASKSVLHRKRTIPEAELDAILFGAKLLINYIPAESKQVCLWTDSLINYHRFNTTSVNCLKYTQARKIMSTTEILRHHQVELQHVKSNDNPADWLTKFPPHFTWEQWIRIQLPAPTLIAVHVRQAVTRPASTETIIDQAQIDMATDFKELTAQYSVETLIKTVQHSEWKREIDCLRQGKAIPRNSVLGPYYYVLTNDIIYTKLRTDDRKLRVLLPADSHLTALIVQHIHEDRAHAGVDTVRQIFMDTYFVSGSRRLVRRLLYGCQTCAKLHGRLLAHVPGPMDRHQCTVPAHAFDRIGVDFAGPIKCGSTPYYILVVTCLNSRAVFLKLLLEQTADATICGLRQLSAIYGKPSYVYSDNANVLKKSHRIMKLLYSNLKEVTDKLAWHYSFAGSPQSNGITEAMVKLTKNTFKGLCLGQQFSLLETETFLTEAAGVINSRPLFRHHGELITPHHLIFGRNIRPIPEPTRTVTKEAELKAFQRIRRRVNGFWRAWRSTYIYNLRNIQLGRVAATIRIGDTVLYEPHSRQAQLEWPTGSVIRLTPGTDGQTRLVDLQLDSGEILTNRPINKIVLTESARAEDVASSTEA